MLEPIAADAEGIFRISGSHKRITDLEALLALPGEHEPNHNIDIVFDYKDVFKRLFRNCKPFFKSRPLEVRQLEEPDAKVWARLMKILKTISEDSEINKMNANNLSIVWVPNLLPLDANVKESTALLASIIARTELE